MATVMATGPTGRASVVDELAMHEEADARFGRAAHAPTRGASGFGGGGDDGRWGEPS